MAKPEWEVQVNLMRVQLMHAQEETGRAKAEASLLRDELRVAQQHTTKLIAVAERQAEVIQGFVVRLPVAGANRPT